MPGGPPPSPTASGTVDRLVRALGRLPGIGAKSAERLAHHLLRCPVEEAIELAEAVRAARDQIRHCEVCAHLTESGQARCAICRDPRRDRSVICVVEQSRDLMALENAGSFGGTYHVLLGRLSPLQGVFEDQLNLKSLEERVQGGEVREVILATNPTLEGDATARLVADRLAPLGVAITRLARGLASGGSLEFANKEMLADALQGRQRL
ncbi:recombination mediator RecR [Tautonia sociabilis]|uniref:Recombination protein RecR n=1 Tax=Tautonia sociabilis TaxID=2080755 RepID=A0A432ME06_9BACT|nr:recombination protein RecR [Tautonia sociabilis]